VDLTFFWLQQELLVSGTSFSRAFNLSSSESTYNAFRKQSESNQTVPYRRSHKYFVLFTLNKHFEEFSEAAQIEIYRSASLQLKIVKLWLRGQNYN